MGNQRVIRQYKNITFNLLILGIIIFLPIQLPLFNNNNYFVANSRLRSSQNESLNSSFTIEKSVELNVSVNFNIRNGPDFQPCYIEIPLFMTFAPYQDVDLIKCEYSSGIKVVVNDYFDDYDNKFDFYKVRLGPYEEFNIYYEYNINLDYVLFESCEHENIDYINSDKNFELYCNYPEEKYDINDPDLIEISNSIVNSTDHPSVKAKKIFKWVISYLEYERQDGQERGASWAYDNKKGDCSEFSSLFITLLRIQEIPARKVVGFVFPELVDRQECLYKYSRQIDNLNCHAWAEYYLPNNVWVPCDPTWNYFNMMDNARIVYTKGSKFYFPPDDQSGEVFTTGFTNFAITCSNEQKYEYNLKIIKLNGDIITGEKSDDDIDFEYIEDLERKDIELETIIHFLIIGVFFGLACICFFSIIKKK